MPARRILSVAAQCAVLGALAGGAYAASPAFDCKRAEGQIEQMICKDDTLAKLDKETTRLYGLALDARSMSTGRKKALLAEQRGWIKGRNDCWKASDARACTLSEYIDRIYLLRQNYAGARTQDDKGISRGPFSVRCPGADALILGTFVQTDPGYAYLTWLDKKLLLPQTRAASGARYGAAPDTGGAMFWDKGPEAQLALPGKPAMTCRVEAPE